MRNGSPGFDCIADIANGFLFGVAFAHAPRQAGDFADPATVFDIGINDNLSHIFDAIGESLRSKYKSVARSRLGFW